MLGWPGHKHVFEEAEVKVKPVSLLLSTSGFESEPLTESSAFQLGLPDVLGIVSEFPRLVSQMCTAPRFFLSIQLHH